MSCINASCSSYKPTKPSSLLQTNVRSQMLLVRPREIPIVRRFNPSVLLGVFHGLPRAGAKKLATEGGEQLVANLLTLQPGGICPGGSRPRFVVDQAAETKWWFNGRFMTIEWLSHGDLKLVG